MMSAFSLAALTMLTSEPTDATYVQNRPAKCGKRVTEISPVGSIDILEPIDNSGPQRRRDPIRCHHKFTQHSCVDVLR
jgi:hypothetical protein